MIIFYSKTGEVQGSIDGRVHSSAHLKMWVGDKDNNRLIINWVKNNQGEFEPDHPQTELVEKIASGKLLLMDFKINPENNYFEPIKSE